MLSETSTATIRATLPAVSASIGEITARFYDGLFAAHPELLRDLFNRGNQANGTQRQALAGAFAAFAQALVDHPGQRPDAMLARIAHKHASLGITRPQYQVVREHLFAAIAEVLGEAATDTVVAAWDEVYWLMANALVAIENRLYAGAGAPDGDTWREHRVMARLRETDDTLTFVVRPADGAPPATFLPGQYVSVRVTLPDGARQIRQYSICGRDDEGLRFTVRRVLGSPDGAAPDGEVSGHLHERVRPGDLLSVSAPFGDVVLDDGEGPLVLASAGIGCTPMIGMLDHLAASGSRRRIVVAHADRSPATHPHRADLEQLVAKLDDATAHVWYEEPDSGADWPAERTGLIDLETVPIPPATTAYLCGPLPFLRAARGQLLRLGVPAADIHYEVFGPDLWLAQG